MSSKPKVFVAMSGGVDSSVATALLKERGFDVHGVHIKMWTPRQSHRVGTGQADPFIPVCRQQHQDRLDAMRVAAVLDIPFKVWDFTKEYKKEVVDYMIKEYKAGRTPNPDVMCNRHIKFGVFLKRALAEGADFVATGHYVRLATRKWSVESSKRKSKINKRQHYTFYTLHSAVDTNKDQSYFLWTLTQGQLKHCLFPIGEFTKPEVRKMAKKFGLPTADKKDSQGICFIGEINLNEFLGKYIKSKPGDIITSGGKKIGKHKGLHNYTIGQRHGLEIGGRPLGVGEPRPSGAGGVPFYVAKKDFKKNVLIVAEGPYDDKLFGNKLIVSNINWISGKEPKLPLKCQARIRYRQPLQNCRVYKFISSKVDKFKTKKLTNLKTYKLRVVFNEPQRAITPGQSVVFYKGREMIGGGIIN